MPTRCKPTDEVVEDKGVKILIDPKAVLFLLGTEMDYKIDKLSAQFVFNNPNQTGACGCGEIGAARRRRRTRRSSIDRLHHAFRRPARRCRRR